MPWFHGASFPEEVLTGSASGQGVAARLPGLGGVDQTGGRGWVGILQGGGKDIPGVPGLTGLPSRPSELTAYALAGFWGYLVISLGVGFCHSLKTVDNNESRGSPELTA